MGRKAHFNHQDFINAALSIIAEDGPGAVTITAIASRIKAPVGSVYHRFPSRELIMAELWLGIAEEFQRGFLQALLEAGGEKAALFTLHWVREYPVEGRVLLLHRREEMMAAEWPAGVQERAARLQNELTAGLVDYVKSKFGEFTRDSLLRTVFAFIDIPLAAVKRHLENGEEPPGIMDELVLQCCETILGRGL